MKSKLLLLILVIFAGWVAVDLWVPRRHNLRDFDARRVAASDAAMWRSYYEKKPLLLFWQSASLMRHQLKAPFWRSFVMAFHAAKAAFIFKDGTNRTQYNKAMPDLEDFYDDVARLSDQPFDVEKAARQELEWWVIRRYREQHPPAEWADLQAKVAGEIYRLPADKFNEYARLRTEAMFFRDQKGDKITEEDWKKVHTMLTHSWNALSQALYP